MKILLWYQDPENMSKDVIFCDGEKITPPSDPRYSEKVAILNSKAKQAKGNRKSDVIKGGCFIKEYFNEKDNKGRNIPFMFFSNTFDENKLTDRLQEAAKCNGFTCSDSLINDIKNDIRKSKREKTIGKALIICAVIAAILLLIVIISKRGGYE